MNISILLGGILGGVATICLFATFLSSWLKKEKISYNLCSTAVLVGLLGTLVCLVGLLYEGVKLI